MKGVLNIFFWFDFDSKVKFEIFGKIQINLNMKGLNKQLQEKLCNVERLDKLIKYI